jgi:signal transduction histidine kinase
VDRQRARAAEASVLLALLGVAGWVVFFGGRWQYPYVLFPLLVWAALRFGQRGAVTAIFVVATLGIWGSVNGAVAIEAASTTQTVQILQALIAVLAVAVMTMAAAIEEQAVAREELTAAVEERGRAEDIKAKFLSMATHEMSTPIAVASGYADLLLGDWKGMGDADKRQAIQRIADQTRRLARLVEGLLATSRADAGQLAVRSQVLDLGQVVAQVLEDVATDSVALNATDRLLVAADRDHVEQMLMNYLSNAMKYGSPPFSVELAEHDGFGVVRVCDQGEGVTEDFVPHLFERFSRAPETVERGVSGTGLGLSIVQDLARAQGGDAWYEPNRPAGACFCVRLPLAPVS